MVAQERGLDITYWMTTGNEVDLSVGETIQLMAEDPEVHTIMAVSYTHLTLPTKRIV